MDWCLSSPATYQGLRGVADMLLVGRADFNHNRAV